MKAKNKALGVTLSILIFAQAAVIGGTNAPSVIYAIKNPKYKVKAVNAAISEYGGDERFVNLKTGFWNIANNMLYDHISSPRKIKIDNSLNEEEKEAIIEVIDYINSIFSIINPKIHFEITNDQSFNIFMEKGYLRKATAETENYYALFNNCEITSSKIIFKYDYKFEKTEFQYVLLHELMHVILGCQDVDESKSKTISVMNYTDLQYIINSAKNHKLETGENFITYMPTDIASFISLYGEKGKKKEKYIALINETLNNCKTFLQKQPYLKDEELTN